MQEASFDARFAAEEAGAAGDQAAPDEPVAGGTSVWMNKEVANEGTGFSEEDLRQVQGDPPPRGGAGDLRKRET
jgi:hypothetical protein